MQNIYNLDIFIYFFLWEKLFLPFSTHSQQMNRYSNFLLKKEKQNKKMEKNGFVLLNRINDSKLIKREFV
jgi:hypothetical protein